MKFIVLVGSLLFATVLSQTEEAVVVPVAETVTDTTAVTQTEGGRKGFGGARGGKGFSPENWKKRPAKNDDGTDQTTDDKKCNGAERSGKGPRDGSNRFPEGGFKGFPKGGVPEGGFKGPKGGFKWGKKPTAEGEAATAEVPAVVVENTSV